MEKIFIILLVILCGCETIKPSSYVQTEIKAQAYNNFNEPQIYEPPNYGPPKTIYNTKCESIGSFRVFQVLDNFVLANVCDGSSNVSLHPNGNFRRLI